MPAGDPAIHIRDSRADEAEAIERLTVAAFEEYAEYAGAGPPGFWVRYRRNIGEAIRERAPAERMVAEAVGGGRLLGSVLLIPAPAGAVADADARGLPEVRLLAVDPAARGLGIGRALMAECLRRARHAGAPALYLHTDDRMRVARGLYERLGFVRAPQHDFTPEPDLLVKGFRLDLGGAPGGIAPR